MRLENLISNGRSEENLVVRPFVIAEAGVNHEVSMEFAKRLIEEAKEGGADAIKFQTYKADTLASKDSAAYWDLKKEPTISQHQLFKKYDKFWKNEFTEIKKHCDKTGIEFLSTPFDFESARFLNELMGVFKISSSDITNKPFIQFISSFGKPIILSTGASNMNEIHEAVSWIEPKGNPLALLHCVLNYPTKEVNANLAMILDLKRVFPKNIVGYSDHTLPGDMKILEVASLLGASILEKHFTFDKTLPGNDHYHAMDKEDLKKLHSRLDKVFNLMGDGKKHSLPSEESARINARRSLIANRKLSKGSIIRSEDLIFKRPGYGISPKEFQKVVGMKLRLDIDKDSLVQWEFLEEVE
jgi:sialic acid synthase SpsE